MIVILPPYADTEYDTIHEARRRALSELAAGGLADPPNPRVAVYGLWDPRTPAGGRGIYCHAKVQMFDGSLLVRGLRRATDADGDPAAGAGVSPHARGRGRVPVDRSHRSVRRG